MTALLQIYSRRRCLNMSHPLTMLSQIPRTLQTTKTRHRIKSPLRLHQHLWLPLLGVSLAGLQLLRSLLLRCLYVCSVKERGRNDRRLRAICHQIGKCVTRMPCMRLLESIDQRRRTAKSFQNSAARRDKYLSFKDFLEKDETVSTIHDDLIFFLIDYASFVSIHCEIATSRVHDPTISFPGYFDDFSPTFPSCLGSRSGLAPELCHRISSSRPLLFARRV